MIWRYIDILYMRYIHLVVILIWWFGEFGLITMSANTDNNQTIPFMSTLFTKLNARQFALHSNFPNSNVPRTYTVLIVHRI